MTADAQPAPQHPDPAWQLNADSSAPLHVQLETLLRQRIASDHWQQGERIPSEREIMQLSGVSRATVRQALASLVHEGILQKDHGRGTFVRHTRYETSLQIVYSFSEQLRSVGVTLTDEILERDVVPAPPDLAARLTVAPDTPLIYIRRLRWAGTIPMMINVAYMPYMYCPDLLREPFDQSLYRLLTEKYNLPILNATDRLEAIAADRDMAALLRVRRGHPLMYVERTAFTRNHTVLHIGSNYIRGDMCSFRSDMHASLEFKKV